MLATTDSAISDLENHDEINNSAWDGRVIPLSSDSVIDPEHSEFKNDLHKLGVLTGENSFSWKGYLAAHRARRLFSKKGATATDHSHPSARTENLSNTEAEKLFSIILTDKFSRRCRYVQRPDAN